ncbi:MAG: recombinase RecA, partial [Proteobacteria bacterium]
KSGDHRLTTGIPSLDTILQGGLIPGSVTVIAGPPGSGKTILSHQIGFHLASPKFKVIYFQTLSEPTAKRLRFLKDFKYFDADKLDSEVSFIDLGEPLRTEGIDTVLERLMEHVREIKPALVVIDSFKVFGDFASSAERYRKFSYEVVVQLMVWECTVVLLGEFAEHEIGQTPLFSVIDGIIMAKQEFISGEQKRIIQVIKMRGTDHSREAHCFKINDLGIQIFTPEFSFLRNPSVDEKSRKQKRCQVGIAKIDKLLGGGIPHGSSVLVAGVAGTGKTIALLEFLYRGASELESKGLFFSFEESAERLTAVGQALGWDIENELKRGMLKIVYIPQVLIRVEEHISYIQKEIETFGAARVAIDSLSVFLDKIESPQIVRDKVSQLTNIIQAAGAVGFFSTSIPYGMMGISRFGVEETVVDGVILLSTIIKGSTRERYLEIYKLRNAAHALGQHKMKIDKGGIKITPKKSRS